MHPALTRRLAQHFGSVDAVPAGLQTLFADVAADYAQARPRRIVSRFPAPSPKCRRNSNERRTPAPQAETSWRRWPSAWKMPTTSCCSQRKWPRSGNWPPASPTDQQSGGLRRIQPQIPRRLHRRHPELLDAYEAAADAPAAERHHRPGQLREKLDIDFLKTDVVAILGIPGRNRPGQENRPGSQGLLPWNEGSFNWANIHAGLDSDPQHRAAAKSSTRPTWSRNTATFPPSNALAAQPGFHEPPGQCRPRHAGGEGRGTIASVPAEAATKRCGSK